MLTITVIEICAEYFCGYMPLSMIPYVHVSNDEVFVLICVSVRVVFFNWTQWRRFFRGIYCPCSTPKGDQCSRGCNSCAYLFILGTTLCVMDGIYLHECKHDLGSPKTSISVHQETFCLHFHSEFVLCGSSVLRQASQQQLLLLLPEWLGSVAFTYHTTVSELMVFCTSCFIHQFFACSATNYYQFVCLAYHTRYPACNSSVQNSKAHGMCKEHHLFFLWYGYYIQRLFGGCS